jgi:ribosomal protein S18 acetylase RimI-like enzyme
MTASITIREAREDDSSRISNLMTELGYELSASGVINRLAEYESIGGRIWVASNGSQVVGFLSFHLITYFHAVGRAGRITSMCVASTHRRSGIGHQLMCCMENFAESMSCERVEVMSGDHREEEAHRFYQAEGYTLSHRRFLKKLNCEQDVTPNA